MARPSLVRIVLGWLCGGVVLYAAGVLLSPLAGAALLILLAVALTVTAGPAAHFMLAKRAAASGSYSPLRTAAVTAGAIIAFLLTLALLGLFDFA